MNTKKLLLGLSILFAFSLITLTSCKDEVKDATCSNGIKDGDETGIDCGGSCDPCKTAENTLCEGFSGSLFIPFDKIKQWDYQSKAQTKVTKTFQGKETKAGTTYYKVRVKDNSFVDYMIDYSIDSKGNIFGKIENEDFEVLIVPVGESIGYSWTNKNHDTESYKLISKTSSYKSPKCSYDNLIEIHHFRNGDLKDKIYYKKGLGHVNTKRVGFQTYDEYLYSVKLN